MQEISSASKEAPASCAACGLSPVNHTFSYILQTFDVWSHDHLRGIRDWRLSRSFHRMMDRLVEAALPIFIGFLKAIRVLTINHDPARAPSYRSQVIWEEAQRRGIEMEQYILFGIPTELFRARVHGRWIYFQSIPISEACQHNTFKHIDDKLLFKIFLREQGIPVADAGCASNLKDAHVIFERLHKPVVVKPRIGSRARHTTTHINSLVDFDGAFKRAQQLCKHVIVEEHLPGGVGRATVVDGKLVGFLQMLPARVTGDGAHTIRELVAMKNESRHPRVAAVTLDAEHESYIGRLGYTADSILEDGKIIDLSRRTGRFEGGETREFPNEVHPKLREYIERAARTLQAPIIGFDVIIPDPQADPDAQRWGILEGNSVPFIDLHYLPLHGEPTNVAAAVWDLWNEKNAMSPKSIGIYMPHRLYKSDASDKAFLDELIRAIKMHGKYRPILIDLPNLRISTEDAARSFCEAHGLQLIIQHDSAFFYEDAEYARTVSLLAEQVQFMNSPRSHQIGHSKIATKNILREAGLPVLDHFIMGNPEEILLLEEGRWYVAKPPDRGAGEGVRLIQRVGLNVREYYNGCWEHASLMQRTVAGKQYLVLRREHSKHPIFLIGALCVATALVMIFWPALLLGIPLALWSLHIVEQRRGAGFEYGQMLIEPYFNDDPEGFASIRCTVVGDQVVEAVRRINMKNITSNVAKGGIAYSVELDESQRKIAVAAAQAIDADYAGVDLLCEKGEIVIGEVNIGPFTLFSKVSNVNVGKLFGEYVIAACDARVERSSIFTEGA